MRIALYIIAWVLAAVSCPLAAESVLKLYPQIQLTGNSVCIEELGTIYARQPERTAFKQTCFDHQELIKSANLSGKVSIDFFTTRIARLQPTLSVVGPDFIAVQTQPPLSSAQLSSAAQAWLLKDLEKRFHSVEVIPIARQATGRWNPELTWDVRKESITPARHQCVWLDGSDKHGVQQSWPACFKVKAIGTVMAYAKDLSVDDVIEPDFIDYKLIDVTTLAGEPAAIPMEASFVASSYVMSGTPLLMRDIRTRPDVLKNGAVVIISRVGHVEILAKGVAIDEGQVGDEIRVKSKVGESAFRAKVTGKDKVTIGGDT